MIRKVFFVLLLLTIYRSVIAEPPFYNRHQNTSSLFKMHFEDIDNKKVYLKNKFVIFDLILDDLLIIYYPITDKFSLSNSTQFCLVSLGEVGATALFSNTIGGWCNLTKRWIFFNKILMDYIDNVGRYGLEFGLAYRYNIFNCPSYISVGYSYNHQIQYEFGSSSNFGINEFRYEWSTFVFNRLNIIYKGNFIPNYSPQMDYLDLMQNVFNIEIRLKKFFQKSKYWSIGLFYGQRIFKHRENVHYIDGGHCYNKKRGLYSNIERGLYIIF